MNTWFSADYHFYDKTIAAVRKMSLEEMHEKIIKRHNERVKKNDTVFFLGDFQVLSSGDRDHSVEEMLAQMNGNFVLINGNHDWNNKGKSKITSATIYLGGMYIFLCHDPADFVSRFRLNLVGHIHGNWKIKTLPNGASLVNVGVDVWNFYPTNIQEITRFVEQDLKEYKNSLRRFPEFTLGDVAEIKKSV